MRIFSAVTLAFLLVETLPAASVHVTVLATTDLHGNIFPYDYFSAQPASRGLAKISKLVEAVRAENPNTLLIDCGDAIQGAPIETVYQTYVRTGKLPGSESNTVVRGALSADPMMIAMNLMRYDAMVLGNHEFNYGLKNLDRARQDARFPWLSANTRVLKASANRAFDGYVVKQVGGVKVAIIGVTTPAIPMWEEASNYKGYEFLPIRETVARVIVEVRAQHRPDVVIVAAHSGLGRDLKTGAAEPDEVAGENVMYDVAANVPGIDAIIFGHTHRELPSGEIHGVSLLQPKNWGISLGRMDLELDNAGGHWRITSKTSRVLPVTRETPVDDAMLKAIQPYQDAAERYLNLPVTSSRTELSSAHSRIEDTAILDAIQKVQLIEAKADVSFASAFNTRAKIAAGPVTVRQIAALYVYDNTLVAVAGNGRMVREALENAARYYRQCTGDCTTGPLINTRMPGFNYDMAEGVEYEVDISQPEGRRIRNLRWHGKPLADDQPLRIAINNYRSGGSGGYTMFQNAKVVWRSTEEIREMIIRHYSEGGSLPSEPDRNWKVVPPGATAELAREADAESKRNSQQ